MAAVLSETITENTYFPKMRRGDERQRSPPSQYRHGSQPRGRVPPSPRTQPTSSVPGMSSNGSQPYPQSGQNIHDEPVRQTFASQSNFPPSSQHQLPAHVQQSQAYYAQQPIPPPLASPADSAHSPITQTAWSPEVAPNTIQVRDLAHIQSFATEEFLSSRGSLGRRRAGVDPPFKYEISSMPIADIIEMVAGLLTKITTTNDRQHENLHRPISSADTSGNMSGLTSSVLAFHGKNVPSITILSYLSRIHKYCPTTYEVFLSLLVYFDRMTERVNAVPLQDMRRTSTATDRNVSRPSTGTQSVEEESEMPRTPLSPSVASSSEELARVHYATPPDDDQIAYNLSHFFVVDSFNIHRLVIAGVTCASKFFSDVFYTNSRYAKVGGLPLAELNHLELQFLLLNDFRLSIPVEELEAYGTMLVEFYAREVIAQRQQSALPTDMAYPDPEDTPMADPTSP